MSYKLNNLKLQGDKGLSDINTTLNQCYSHIEALEEENRKLKDEHYKDAELQRMKQEVEDYKDDLFRGFPISKEEKKSIDEWRENHIKTKHPVAKHVKKYTGCSIGYEFFWTELGLCGKVFCEQCRNRALEKVGLKSKYRGYVDYYDVLQESIKEHDSEFMFQAFI